MKPPADLTPAYRYRATCVRVIDGDTYVLAVDLGFRATVQLEVRVLSLDAPELHDEGGSAAKAAAEALIVGSSLLPELTIETFKNKRSFTRWLTHVWLPDGRSVAAVLTEQGHGGRPFGKP